MHQASLTEHTVELRMQMIIFDIKTLRRAQKPTYWSESIFDSLFQKLLEIHTNIETTDVNPHQR